MKLCPTSLQTNRNARQTFAALIVSYTLFNFGFSRGWISSTVTLFETQDSPVKLTPSQLSMIVSGSFVGAFMGLVPGALLMDYAGRKGTLLLLNTLPVAGWLLTYYARDFPTLFTAICLTGSWTGVVLTISILFISEISDPSIRAQLYTFPTFMMNLGTVTALAIGGCISYEWLSVSGLMFTLPNWLLLALIPESPYYYAMRGQRTKGIDALRWFTVEKSVDEEFNKIEKFVETVLKSDEGKLHNIWKNRTITKTIVVVIIANCLLTVSGGNWIMLAPISVPNPGFFSLGNYECATVLSVAVLISSVRLPYFNRFSNKFMLITFSCISGSFLFLISLWWFLEKRSTLVKDDLHWVPFCSFLVILCAHTNVVQPIVSGLKGELLPTEVKATVSAFSTGCGCISVFFQLAAFNTVTDVIGKYFNFVISSLGCFSLTLLTVFCITETKGKSLIEIQNEITNITNVNCKTQCKPNTQTS